MSFFQKQLYDEYSETVESADLKSESEVHVFQSLQFLRKVRNLRKYLNNCKQALQPVSLDLSVDLLSMNRM